jgi:O-antigen/teichoic acid export membrane protein
VFVPEWILDLLYAKHVSEAALVLPWTMGAAALFSLQYTTGTLLTAAGKMKPLIVLSILALLGNIACNFVWIPSQASVGAAKAAFVTQAFVLLVQLVLTQRIFRTWSSGLILRTLAFAAILCSVAVAVASWLNNPSHIFLLITASTALVGVFLNMIPLRELIAAVKPTQRADTHPS